MLINGQSPEWNLKQDERLGNGQEVQDGLNSLETLEPETVLLRQSAQFMVRSLFRGSHELLLCIAKPKTTPMKMPILMPTGRFFIATPPIMPSVIPTSNQRALNLAARFGDLSFMFTDESSFA